MFNIYFEIQSPPPLPRNTTVEKAKWKIPLHYLHVGGPPCRIITQYQYCYHYSLLVQSPLLPGTGKAIYCTQISIYTKAPNQTGEVFRTMKLSLIEALALSPPKGKHLKSLPIHRNVYCSPKLTEEEVWQQFPENEGNKSVLSKYNNCA